MYIFTCWLVIIVAKEVWQWSINYCAATITFNFHRICGGAAACLAQLAHSNLCTYRMPKEGLEEDSQNVNTPLLPFWNFKAAGYKIYRELWKRVKFLYVTTTICCVR